MKTTWQTSSTPPLRAWRWSSPLKMSSRGLWRRPPTSGSASSGSPRSRLTGRRTRRRRSLPAQPPSPPSASPDWAPSRTHQSPDPRGSCCHMRWVHCLQSILCLWHLKRNISLLFPRTSCQPRLRASSNWGCTRLTRMTSSSPSCPSPTPWRGAASSPSTWREGLWVSIQVKVT